jgi:hypothetical protein
MLCHCDGGTFAPSKPTNTPGFSSRIERCQNECLEKAQIQKFLAGGAKLHSILILFRMRRNVAWIRDVYKRQLRHVPLFPDQTTTLQHF